MSSSEPLDSSALDALLDATGGDPAFLAEMIDTYLADSAEQFTAIDNALAGGEAGELRRASHSLKSNSATFGALNLAETCRQIEDLAKAENLDVLPPLIALAKSEYDRVRGVLETTRAEL
jgi:HPt (histidine-containing phosphotransfer) domain-containing protein